MQYNFRGGVNPLTFKSLASDRPIKKTFIPKKVVLPLSQHTGSPAEPVISVGATVNVGDCIAKPSGYISSAIHASISGKVTRIAHFPTHNQPRVLSIVIESQGDEDQDFRLKADPDVAAFTAKELLGMIRDAGVVGLGGAGFPTDVKLSPPQDKTVDTVILNGAECEPYLTCDHRLMLEKTVEILKGLDIIVRILGAKQVFIAIEKNKMSAIYAMERALKIYGGDKVRMPKIVALDEKYPQGAEKQIIKVILNRIVPAGGLPMDVGCVANNVGTAYAVYEAVYHRKPLIERAITITGSCVKDPVNTWVRLGTMLTDLNHVFGGFIKEPKKIILGGPMMGTAQYSMEIPISKGVGGIVFLAESEIDQRDESVCIRCGRCIDACPIGLVPTTLMYRVKGENFSEAKTLGIMNCYECGACAYTCPAKIPLVDYMKFGKVKNQTV